MDKKQQAGKARTLLALHTGGKLLVLPNIWDPVGARILEAKGYPAVATASAAISASHGFRDGEKIKLSTLIGVISRIADSVNVPVTADIEAGYGETVSQLKETIVSVIESGAAGINIEDSFPENGALRPADEQCERIAAVREISSSLGLHLVINARTDAFLTGSLSGNEARIEECIRRAKAYSEAGADCIYPIGPGDMNTLKVLRKRISSPVNVLASPGAEPLAVLEEIGINRVSFGPFVFRSCLKKFSDIVESLRSLKGYECFGENMMSKDEVNEFLVQENEK